MNSQTMNLQETKAYLKMALAYVVSCETRNHLLAEKHVEKDLNQHFVSEVNESVTQPVIDQILTDAKYIQRCLTKADAAFKYSLESWIYNAEIEEGFDQLDKSNISPHGDITNSNTGR